MATSQPAQKDSTIFFSCGDHLFTARDAIDAAWFRGELEAHWFELLRLEAAQEHAAEKELEIADGALESASEAFRYEHDLITAEETEAWLERRGLTLREFSEFFARQHWGAELEGKVEAVPVDYVEASAEMRDLLVTQLTLAGELDWMATQMSWRVAANASLAETPVPAESIESERKKFLERAALNSETLPKSLDGLGRDEHWLNEMAQMEAAYHQQRDAALTPAARARELADLRLPLTKFDVEVIELESLDAAREAYLCVHDDEMTLEDVAAESHYPYRRMTALLEDIAAHQQQKFLSAAAGSLLDPIERGEGYQLCRLLAKMEPDVEDPTVRDRADGRILDRHFGELSARHLHWRIIIGESE